MITKYGLYIALIPIYFAIMISLNDGKQKDSSIPEDKNLVNSSEEKSKIEDDDERVNISISRKAYDALETFTEELNHGGSKDHRLFTVEEVLDEEIVLLFSDKGSKEAFLPTVQDNEE